MSGARQMVVALTALTIGVSSGCTSTDPSPGDKITTPLDESALVTLEDDTAVTANDIFTTLTSAGATVDSAVGSWGSCADVDPSFGQFIVVGSVTIPAGEPIRQMDPLVAALESDGWAGTRETAPKGNELADLRRSNSLLQLTTDGSTDLPVDLIGPCIQSDLMGTEGYRFSVDHTPIDVG